MLLRTPPHAAHPRWLLAECTRTPHAPREHLEFQMVLSDVALPHMDGMQLVDQLCGLNPHLIGTAVS
ncbi:MAG: hypothetical protein ACYC4D_05660 [Thermoleophilia bacterium]